MASLNDSNHCRNISFDEAKGYVYSDFERIFIVYIVPAIMLIGLSTNGGFLFVIHRVNNMRTATNFYLANLAVADSVLLIATSMNYLVTYVKSPIQSGYPFKAPGCAFSLLVIYVFSYASIAFLTLVAIERYQAVCMPISYRQRNIGTRKMNLNLKLTIITWVTLIFVVVWPVSFVYQNVECVSWPDHEQFNIFPSAITMCKWAQWSFMVLDLFDLCEFSIALVINVVVYIRIVQELNKRQQPSSISSIARSHVARMLSINAIVFFLCLSPIQLSNIAEFWNLVNNKIFYETFYGPTTDFVILWLGRVAFLINSTVNPIIYNISNPEYRKAFMKAFALNKKKTLRRGTLQTTGKTTAETDMGIQTQSAITKNRSANNTNK